MILRQHRTMETAAFAESFAPIVQCEKREIHPVFPLFPHFPLGQNLSAKALAPLCGIALTRRPGVQGNSGAVWRGFLTGIASDAMMGEKRGGYREKEALLPDACAGAGGMYRLRLRTAPP